MNTFRFGRLFWGLFHQLPACIYPKDMEDRLYSEKEKSTLYRFTELIPSVLPCGKCRKHFARHWRRGAAKMLIEEVDTPLDWSRWWIIVHNIVNDMLKRPQFENCDYYVERQAIHRRSRKVDWFWFLDNSVWQVLLVSAANVDFNQENTQNVAEWISILVFQLLPLGTSKLFLEISSQQELLEQLSLLKPTSKAWFDFMFSHYARWRTRDEAWCGVVKHGVTSHCPSRKELWDAIQMYRAL